MTTRAEWQQLAEDRIEDARAHLVPGVNRWSAAYYLIGYAVECGLKACLLAQVEKNSGIIYSERKFLSDAWTHDPERLLVLAGLRSARNAEYATNPAFESNWSVVKDWNEQSRYLQKTQTEAQKLFDAVTDTQNGVMQWIRARW